MSYQRECHAGSRHQLGDIRPASPWQKLKFREDVCRFAVLARSSGTKCSEALLGTRRRCRSGAGMRYDGRRDIAEVAPIAFGRPMPDAAPECGDIDLAGIVSVWDDRLSPLEIEPRNALP